jgi:putative redox protein
MYFMSKTLVTYRDNLVTEITHESSGSTITTDLSKELGGNESSFSPTDLVAGALGACLLSTMGLIAKRQNISIEGTTATVEKANSTTTPLRLAKLATTIRVPNSAQLTEEHRLRLERATLHCTVHHSLHPEIEASVKFVWE